MSEMFKPNSNAKKIVIAFFVIIPLLLFVLVEIRDYYNDNEITVNKGVTRGVVTEIKYGRNPTIKWKYKVKSKSYEGFTLDTKQFNFIKFCPNWECLGDTFIVEYSKLNPEKSRLVIEGVTSYR